MRKEREGLVGGVVDQQGSFSHGKHSHGKQMGDKRVAQIHPENFLYLFFSPLFLLYYNLSPIF